MSICAGTFSSMFSRDRSGSGPVGEMQSWTGQGEHPGVSQKGGYTWRQSGSELLWIFEPLEPWAFCGKRDPIECGMKGIPLCERRRAMAFALHSIGRRYLKHPREKDKFVSVSIAGMHSQPKVKTKPCPKRMRPHRLRPMQRNQSQPHNSPQ